VPTTDDLPAAFALDVALDPQLMNTYLRPRLPWLAQGDGMTVVRCTLLDCKPGKRALVRYEITAPPQRANMVVFGKIYCDLAQLMRVDQVMETLWCALPTRGGCGTPQPLGVVPELAMHLYVPAAGQFLDTLLAGQQATQAMQWTAGWLAALHRQPLPLTKRFDLANELENLAAWAALVGQAYPESAALAHQLLGYMQRQAPSLALATTMPIHKDFHYRHVLVGQGVKVIDFDEVRLGDPTFDLAHFCANLHLLAYRQQGAPDHFRTLERRFLRTYAQRSGQSWTAFVQAHREQLRFFYRYTCIKLARQLALGFGPSPAPTGDQRRRQVQMILEQGNQL
jgi:hypothetical protein